MLLRFDRARSGRPVGSKTVSGRARSGVLRVDFSGSWVFPDHVAHSSFNPFWTIRCTYDINFGFFTINLAIESTLNTIFLRSTIISMGHSSDD